MSNKNSLNEIALTATENFAKEIILGSATSFLEEVAKSVPIASTALALTKAYSNYKTAKDQRQLLAFIQAADEIDDRFIERFFQNSNNTELGFEILGILDQTYLEKQARMIGRVTLLFKNGKIPKQDFDKYTYISTRLNSHLILLIDELYSIETNQDDPEFEFDIENPNMEFISFQFLVEVPSPLNLDGKTKIARYKRTNSFFYFYENIFKD